jgi:hypothetical protein
MFKINFKNYLNTKEFFLECIHCQLFRIMKAYMCYMNSTYDNLFFHISKELIYQDYLINKNKASKC